MDTRKLKKGAAVWKQGDSAKTIGVIEGGHFGVLVDGHLTGILWKGMVIGEGALLATSGATRPRTASVFALEDGAAIREIDIGEFRSAFDVGDRFLVGPTLVTLVGQIVRNCLLLIDASADDRIVSRTMRALMESTMEGFRERPEVESWSSFLGMVGVLVASRDYTDRLRAELGIDGSDRAAIRRASEAARETFKGHESIADLVALIDAEQRKTEVVKSAHTDSDLAFLVRN